MAYRIFARALPVIGLLSMTVRAFAQDSNMVVIKNFDYSSMNLTVVTGTTMIWKNLDGEPHIVVSVDGAFHSQALDQNDTFSFKFDKPSASAVLLSDRPCRNRHSRNVRVAGAQWNK